MGGGAEDKRRGANESKRESHEIYTERHTTQDSVKPSFTSKYLAHRLIQTPNKPPYILTLIIIIFFPAHLAASVSLSHPSVLNATTLGCAVAYSANASPRNEDCACECVRMRER